MEGAMNKANQPRIAYVVKRYPRFSETFIVNEILQHEAAGVDMEIFALRPSVDTHFQNIISEVRAPVNYLPTGSVKSRVFWQRCHKLAAEFPNLWDTLSNAELATVDEAYQAIELAVAARAKNVSHLHAHFATSAATVSRLAAKIAGIEYSVTMHAKDIFHESVVQNDLQQKIADARFVVTVSDFNKQFLTSNFGHAEKIHRIYNGLDLELFEFQKKSKNTRSIISVGRLVPKKGFRYLIDACKILRDQGVDFRCEIIGTGELEDELQDQIRRLEIGHQVQLTGPKPQNIIREKIRDATVFAAPCVIGDDGNRDGLPTVITESLAIGTPCISTDVTGIPEIVRHEETGIIVAQQNARELADELRRLLGDSGLCRTLAENSRQLIEQEFNAVQNVAQIRELIAQQSSSLRGPHFTKQFQGTTS